LVSIAFWWTGLRAWAEARFGYLEIEAIGVTPFAWVLLVTIGGVTLVAGLLPSRSHPSVNIGVAVLALVGAAALAGVNLAYGAADGISPAGWAMAGLSLGQVAVFAVGLSIGHRRLG
jgi:hypothetical protein